MFEISAYCAYRYIIQTAVTSNYTYTDLTALDIELSKNQLCEVNF